MIREPVFQGRRDLERLVDTTPVVVCNREGDRRPMVFQLLAVAARAARVAPESGTHVQVAPLNMVRRHLVKIGLAAPTRKRSEAMRTSAW